MSDPVSALLEIERVAACMFFDVAMQSAFALEDPNARFAIAFQHADALGPNVTKLGDVASRSYTIEVDGITSTFDVRPPNSRALSRVLLQGDVRHGLMEFLIDGMDKAAYFDLKDLGLTALPEEITEQGADSGIRTFRLVVHDGLDKTHDVIAMFAWGLASDKGAKMELSAWPIDKTVEFKP